MKKSLEEAIRQRDVERLLEMLHSVEENDEIRMEAARVLGSTRITGRFYDKIVRAFVVFEDGNEKLVDVVKKALKCMHINCYKLSKKMHSLVDNLQTTIISGFMDAIESGLDANYDAQIMIGSFYQLDHFTKKDFVPHLIKKLTTASVSYMTKCFIIQALGWAGATEAVPIIRILAKNEKFENYAKIALWNLGEREFIASIIQSGDMNSIQSLFFLLIQMPIKEKELLFPIIVTLVENKDKSMRDIAFKFLIDFKSGGDWKSQEVISYLLPSLLKQKNIMDVDMRIISLLVHFNAKEVIPYIISSLPLLDSKEVEVDTKIHIILAIGDMKISQAIPSIMNAWERLKAGKENKRMSIPLLTVLNSLKVKLDASDITPLLQRKDIFYYTSWVAAGLLKNIGMEKECIEFYLSKTDNYLSKPDSYLSSPYGFGSNSQCFFIAVKQLHEIGTPEAMNAVFKILHNVMKRNPYVLAPIVNYLEEINEYAYKQTCALEFLRRRCYEPANIEQSALSEKEVKMDETTGVAKAADVKIDVLPLNIRADIAARAADLGMDYFK